MPDAIPTGLNPGLDPTRDLPSPRHRKSFAAVANSAVSSTSVSPSSEPRQQRPAPATLQQPQKPHAKRTQPQDAVGKQLDSSPAGRSEPSGHERSTRTRRSLSFDTGKKCDEALPVCAPHLWCPRRACLLTSLLGIWAMGARAACRAACEAFAVGPHWWLLLRGSSTCTRPPSRARAAPPHALLLLDSGVRSCTRSSR